MRTLPLAPYAGFSLFVSLIGVWIVIAPTAIGYQTAPAPWVAATWNDTIVGAVLTLVGLGLLAAQLISYVRNRVRAISVDG